MDKMIEFRGNCNFDEVESFHLRYKINSCIYHAGRASEWSRFGGFRTRCVDVLLDNDEFIEMANEYAEMFAGHVTYPEDYNPCRMCVRHALSDIDTHCCWIVENVENPHPEKRIPPIVSILYDWYDSFPPENADEWYYDRILEGIDG